MEWLVAYFTKRVIMYLGTEERQILAKPRQGRKAATVGEFLWVFRRAKAIINGLRLAQPVCCFPLAISPLYSVLLASASWAAPKPWGNSA
jgi:hypothetical protein